MVNVGRELSTYRDWRRVVIPIQFWKRPISNSTSVTRGVVHDNTSAVTLNGVKSLARFVEKNTMLYSPSEMLQKTSA